MNQTLKSKSHLLLLLLLLLLFLCIISQSTPKIEQMKTSMASKTVLILFSLLFYCTANAQLIFKNGFEFTLRLNDTGITWGGDYPSGNNDNPPSCTSNITSPQDCNQGRDFTHNDDTDGHAGFSFTKLDLNGIPLADQSVDYATTPWACVKDNVTGFVWEVKTADGGIHDKNNTYRWGGITHQGSNFGTYYNDWDVLVNGINSETLCGFNDWRVPNTTQLMSIVDNSVNNPSIDANYFPNTNSSVFWSASPFAVNSSSAWGVYFSFGSNYNVNRNFIYNVRLLCLGK